MSTRYIDATALGSFKTFAEECGWVEEATKGEWEVLRMRHALREHPLLVHRRKRPELGLTLHGESARIWALWSGIYGEQNEIT